MRVAAAISAALIVTLSAAVSEVQVRPDGVGPLKIGMSVGQASRALGERIAMPRSKEDRYCFYVTPKRWPHLDLMFENGRLGRIDLGGRAQTSDGLRLGDRVQKVRKFYGRRLQIQPHFYTGPQEQYLTVLFGSGRFATRFETDRGRISAIYSGSYDQVQYVEGCLYNEHQRAVTKRAA